MALLDDIVRHVRIRFEQRRSEVPLAELQARAGDLEAPKSLKRALTRSWFSVIAEHKRCSPTGGSMSEANLRDCIALYDATPWISAISVLTEQDYFKGSLEDLETIRQQTNKPLLLKDFVVDEYQIWEARARGADAVLLMASLHRSEPNRLADLHGLASSIGLSTLVEIGMGEGTAMDAEALAAMVPPKAEVVGVNCRRFVGDSKLNIRATVSSVLRSYVTRRDLLADASQLPAMRSLIPQGRIAVAESGVANADQLRGIRDAEYRAALIGTAFLKGPETVADRLKHFDQAFRQAKVPSRDRVKRRRIAHA